MIVTLLAWSARTRAASPAMAPPSTGARPGRAGSCRGWWPSLSPSTTTAGGW